MTPSAPLLDLIATDLADRLDGYAALDPPPCCWIETATGQASHDDYCPACATAAVAKLPELAGAEIWQRSDPPAPDDSCCHCSTCGALLAYALTEAGVDEELAHFAAHPPAAPLSRDTAYHIARIVEAAPDDTEAVALATRAIAAIPVDA